MKKRLRFTWIIISAICFMLMIGKGDIFMFWVSAEESFPGTVVLGRPTTTTMTASITSEHTTKIYLAWGTKSGSYTEKSKIMTSTEAAPAVITMSKLLPDQTYFYSLYYMVSGATKYTKRSEESFSTPKSEGSQFNFVIQSDSHLLNKADKELYTLNMQNMAALNPDFMMDLGDTFLNDNGGSTGSQDYDVVAERYREQLQYFDIVTRGAALFLTIGNHEGEYGSLLDGTINNLAMKSIIARTTYYPNPIPNKYYSGNSTKDPLAGYLQNYYAYTWGDALFVTIDPYLYSTQANPKGGDNKGDGWAWTLGKTQYDWFRTTLENSKAKYKFVFTHHAIGNIRGGKQVANLYEWGGYDKNGKYLFDEKRLGWGKPIQQIMKDTGVTIFFQGHDHLFAREVVDGVVYQTLPKPAEKVADKQNNFISYTGADVLTNSGFLNVSVSKSKVQVEYHRNYYVSSDAQSLGVVYSYSVDSTHKVTVIKSRTDNLDNYGKNDTTLSSGEKGAISGTGLTKVNENAFSFAVEADPHFDDNTSTTLIQQTMTNIVSAAPSFLIDLGDTSMIEKVASSEADVISRYELIKSYFTPLNKILLYMVSGNHDGENGYDTKKSEIGMFAKQTRLSMFPFPSKETTNFSGNIETANYYSYTKGNADFIILDPYTYSTDTVGKEGGWATTLGKTQYEWLKKTLAASTADFKFVFIHNLTGAKGKDSRGGSDSAGFYEWGGCDESGHDEFSSMRQGWDMPIHDLLVKYGVNVVFHGHDHFYAMQKKDGIIYQLVPQPGATEGSVNSATEYGYYNGTILPAAGYLRVVVDEDKSIVEYIKTGSGSSVTIPNVYTIYK